MLYYWCILQDAKKGEKMSLSSIIKDCVKDQFEDICDLDTDYLIDILDIDEDTVDQLKLALKSWIRSDFGEKQSVQKRTFR